MHEEDKIELELKQEAQRISERYNGAPAIIIVAGSKEAGVKRVMTASYSTGEEFRLRDLVGILQTSIQIESWKHFRGWK